ncbi:hypothetical protein Tco_1263803 [Tanacetum coccineum]
MSELLLNECMEKAQTESNLSITNTNDDMNIELSKEFLTELQSNAYHKKFDEDVVKHIAKVLEILNLIKILNVDTDRLHVKVFPLSLADNAKQWWIDDNNVDEFSYYELMAWLDSRHDDMRIDGMTKSGLCHSWIYGWGDNESSNDIVSSDDEWEEYKYGNPPETTTDSFFKPFMKTQEKNNIKRDDERSQTKRKYINTSNSNDGQPNKRVCKVEKFEAIKYSLGPNEEYIAIRRCEYDTWERNEDSMSKIY